MTNTFLMFILLFLTLLAICVVAYFCWRHCNVSFDRKGGWARRCPTARRNALADKADFYIVTAFNTEGQLLRKRGFLMKEEAISYALFAFGPKRVKAVVEGKISSNQLELICSKDHPPRRNQASRCEIHTCEAPVFSGEMPGTLLAASRKRPQQILVKAGGERGVGK